jgi:hypothetical protein
MMKRLSSSKLLSSYRFYFNCKVIRYKKIHNVGKRYDYTTKENQTA